MDKLVETAGLTRIDTNLLSSRYTPQGRVVGHQNILRPGLELGDFEGRSYEQIIAMVGNTVERKYQDAYNFWKQNGKWPTSIEAAIIEKRNQLNDFAKHLESLRTSRSGVLEDLHYKYEEADLATRGQDMKTRIAARIKAAGGKVKRVTDLDGTITANPDQYLRVLIPGGELVENLLDEQSHLGDPQTLLDVYAMTHQGMTPEAPGILRLAGSHPSVDLRVGVDEFFERFSDEEITIITCSCPEFAYGVLDKIPKVGDVRIWGVSDYSSVSVSKRDIIMLLALQDSRPISYKGDGSSDVQALSPYVAYYYALEGKGFEKPLKQQGYPYLTYRNFGDILQHEQDLATLAA